MLRRITLTILIAAAALYFGHETPIEWCRGPVYKQAEVSVVGDSSAVACEAYTRAPSGVIYTGCYPDGIRAFRPPHYKTLLIANTTGYVSGIQASHSSTEADEIFFCQVGGGIGSVKVVWTPDGPQASKVQTVVSQHGDGSPINACNALWLEEESRSILFTDSSVFPLSEFVRDVMHKGSGRLDLAKIGEGKATTIIDNLHCANGINCSAPKKGVVDCLMVVTYDIGHVHELKIDLSKKKLLKSTKHEVGPVLLDNIQKLNETWSLIGAPVRVPRWIRPLMALPKLPTGRLGRSLSASMLGQLIAKQLLSFTNSGMVIWNQEDQCLVERIKLPKGADVAVSEGFPIYLEDVERQERSLLMGSYGPYPIRIAKVSI